MRSWYGLVLLPLVAACSNQDAGSIAAGLQTKFIETADVRNAAAEVITTQNRSAAMGVVTNLNGTSSIIRSKLGADVVLFGPLPLPEARRYIEEIRDRLLHAWPYPLGIGIPVVEITSGSAYNAEALADNTIELPIGVLQQAQTEDEVAFVVGHELGHLLMKHQARRQAQLNQADTAIKVASAIGFVAATLATGRRSGSQVIVSEGSKTTIAASTLGGQMTGAEVLTTLIDPGWNRRQEEQADLIGIDLLTAAGYNPRYASQTFDVLMAQEKQLEATVAAARKQEAEHPAPVDLTNLNVLGAVFRPISEGLRSLRVNHPDTAAREAAVAGYRDRFYTVQESRAGNVRPLDRLKASRPFRKASDAVAAMARAREDIASNNARGAIAEAQRAQRLLPGWWAPPYVAGVAAIDAGLQKEGMAALNQAANSPDTPYFAYERIAFEYSNAGDVAGAMQVLDKAATRFGGPDVTWLDRINIYASHNDEGAVKSVRDQCSKSLNINIRETCSKTTFSSLFQQ